MKLRMILIILLAVIRISTAFSVDVPGYWFDYDAAGNRKIREYKDITLKQGIYEEGNEQIGVYGINIYPNPAKSFLELKISNLKKDSKAILKIVDVLGRLVMEKEKLSESNTLDVSKFTNGIYIMEIIIDGNRSNWKIIKEE